MRRILLPLLLLTIVNSYAQTDTLFWFAAPDISSDYSYDKTIVLKISSYQQPCIVTVSQPANGGLPIQTFSLPANSIQSFDLTTWLDQIECAPGNVVQNKGLKISSNNKIGVYYEVNGNGPNPEMFALKGRNALGTKFFISSQNILDNTPTYDPLPYSSFNIVATEDNCILSIIPTSNIIGHLANVPFQLTLNKGQTYAAIASSQAAAQHLSGSVVSSTKPIAVTLSDDLLFGNLYGGICSDLAGDQTVPVTIVGNEYIAFKSDLNNPHDKVYITATQNLTDVFQDGVLANTLNSGQSIELPVTNSSTYIKSSAPVYVYQLSGVGCEVGTAILPKINCTGSSSVSVARSTIEAFVITILVKNGAQNSFQVNNSGGVVTGASFNVVPGTGGLYYFARISLPLSGYPNGSVITIANSKDVFQLGVLQGGVNSGASFGYFSDFNSLQANANTGTKNPCAGATISLSAETISSATYTWTGPKSFLSDVQNPSINNISSANTGDYFLKVAVPGCGTYNDTIHIKVNPVSSSTINYSICQGQTFEGYSTTGSYIDTLAAANGCDSIRKINLIVKPSASSIINLSICQGQQFAGYNATGSYIDTLISANGCDSMRTINLLIKPRSSSTITQTICQGDIFLGYNSTGTYIDTLRAANGCDSIRMINLTVKPILFSIINKAICTGQSYQGYSYTGTYIDTLVTTAGCDSIRTINLTLSSTVISFIDRSICQGENYVGYTHSGIYTDTLVSFGGCDSIRTINLIIKPILFTTINQVICEGENYAGYFKTGSYIDTLKNGASCDSIRTIHLVVRPSYSTTLNKVICKGATYSGYALTGTYIDTLSASNGCDSIQTLNLTVVDLPQPDLGVDVAICREDSITLRPGTFLTYLWHDGSTQGINLANAPGLYFVTVTNMCGSAKDEIFISERSCDIYFPNAFTPNSDQKNDVFKILNGDRTTNFYFAIYDRWGEKVFEANDYKKGWDGNKNNLPADAGTYIWYCKFKDSNILKTMKGSVILIR